MASLSYGDGLHARPAAGADDRPQLQQKVRRLADRQPLQRVGHSRQQYPAPFERDAIYAVGNEDFWNFLDPSYLLWLENKVRNSDPNLAFDCAWEAFIEDSSAEKPNDVLWTVTQHIYSKFVSCDEIVNIAGGPEIAGQWCGRSRTSGRRFRNARSSMVRSGSSR
jgi:hypothetical protein